MLTNAVKRIRVRTLTCPSCKAEIYSRAHHDYRTCYCGGIAVDGGFEYFRFVFNTNNPKPVERMRYIKATKQQLYEDWASYKDNFGVFNVKGDK